MLDTLSEEFPEIRTSSDFEKMSTILSCKENQVYVSVPKPALKF